jgi:hypothetical protein
MRAVSRRSVLFSAALPALVTPPFSAQQLNQPDAHLLALGRRFEFLATQIDDQRKSPPLKDLLLFGSIHDEIAATRARTIDGLCEKAKAGCWTLLGDFESVDDSATGARMAFSIMRDLIRMHAPHLEHPGALKTLLREDKPRSW